MGGPGSGNPYHWWRGGKKEVVEHCRALDVKGFTREGALKAGTWRSGTWRWSREGQRPEEGPSIGYVVNTRVDPPWLWLHYTLTATQERVDYAVGLTTTRQRFGGLLWWFLCPLANQGGVRPPGRQALPAARRALLRLPAVPRADLHLLPGEPQVRRAAQAHGRGLRPVAQGREPPGPA
jgi:hypothetical protein